MPKIAYLDDRPVFEDDRRFAAAYAIGGYPEEREERKRVKKEKHTAMIEQVHAFAKMRD